MEIQNVVDYCMKCSNMTQLLEKRRQKIELTEKEIDEIRFICARCRNFFDSGIYKADAILTSLELHEQLNRLSYKRNVGKKPIRQKQYGTAIKNLRAEGKTIREIAAILGISKTTVQKILKSE